MKISARQLTFLYFSVVATAIIVIHASVFHSTTEDMERLYAENRLQRISDYLLSSLDNHQIEKQGQFYLQTQGKAKFDPLINIVFDPELLPPNLNIPLDAPLGIAFEAEDEENQRTYFVIKENFGPSFGNAYLLLDNSFYELIEERLLTSSTQQIVISFALLFISLFVVYKLSAKLTQPLSIIAEDISHRHAQVLEPIKSPPGIIPVELHQLIESFNAYQEKIIELIERERAFNRYASHELRTPLMVMKGALSLLGESNEPEFVERQRQRLLRATNEMNEFIQTLLSLTRLPSEQVIHSTVSQHELAHIIDNHRYLLEGKPVSVTLDISQDLQIKMPEPAFNILVGNLIKNAFANTHEGQISIICKEQSLQIVDTGIGLESNEKASEGYGLGLLLVKDICKKYRCQFALEDNQNAGCTATIHFS